jgi:CheY-like chemotaxis protein
MTDYDAEFRREFREETEDALHEIEVRLSNMKSSSGTDDEIRDLGQYVHMLRLKARAVDEGMIETVLHRFHGYLRELTSLEEHQFTDLEAFADVVRGILSGAIESNVSAIPEMVRSLPSYTVVVPERTLMRWFERELSACGYRFFGARTSFEAIEVTVRTKPDMIVLSGQIDQLSRVDLACAFRSMPSTRDIPVALLTKGKNFGEELADALSEFGIA